MRLNVKDNYGIFFLTKEASGETCINVIIICPTVILMMNGGFRFDNASKPVTYRTFVLH